MEELQYGFEEVRGDGNLLFESIRGSHLFGLNTETSDIDTYGVFIAPPGWILGLGLNSQETIRSEKNDDSWSELSKYFKELGRSNPEALCSLYTPPDLIKYSSPLLEPLWKMKDSLVTKQSFAPFSSYAVSQVKKAKGLKKAINISPNEVKERKTILEFCQVSVGGGSVTLSSWLASNGIDQACCGISRVPRTIETYALYADPSGDINYRGLIIDGSNQLRLSSIPEDVADNPLCHFQYNSNAFTKHCTDYKRYWDWVKNRNPERFKLNEGYDFDSKNMCHCVRLISMAIEIANGDGIILDRSGIDRDFLLAIKNHEVNYDDLMKYVDELELKMENSFANSCIPDCCNLGELDKLLISIRRDHYGFSSIL